jgi:hypothetical protein
MENKSNTVFGKIKWFFTEIMKMYSSEKSYFSKKRVESGIAFAISQWGMIWFLIKKIDVLTASDMLIWAGIEFAVAGYMINQIQKEKKTEDTSN